MSHPLQAVSHVGAKQTRSHITVTQWTAASKVSPTGYEMSGDIYGLVMFLSSCDHCYVTLHNPEGTVK